MGSVNDREELTLVVFAEPDTEPRLGAYAPEGRLLSPDPIRRQLVPVPGLLKAAEIDDAAFRRASAGISIRSVSYRNPRETWRGSGTALTRDPVSGGRRGPRGGARRSRPDAAE
jgi:hypothetical protein